MSQELLDKAKSLGVNAEGLTEAQLKKAIAAAEKLASEAAEASSLLREKAKGFGISTEDKSDVEIAEEITDFEATVEATKKAFLFSEKLNLLVDFLQIENFENLSPEELKELLDKKATETANSLEVTETEVDGKTSESFEFEGKEFVFAEDAPGSFRYFGKLQTQEEWIRDKTAMELMISTKVSYITSKN